MSCWSWLERMAAACPRFAFCSFVLQTAFDLKDNELQPHIPFAAWSCEPRISDSELRPQARLLVRLVRAEGKAERERERANRRTSTSTPRVSNSKRKEDWPQNNIPEESKSQKTQFFPIHNKLMIKTKNKCCVVLCCTNLHPRNSCARLHASLLPCFKGSPSLILIIGTSLSGSWNRSLKRSATMAWTWNSPPSFLTYFPASHHNHTESLVSPCVILMISSFPHSCATLSSHPYHVMESVSAAVPFLSLPLTRIPLSPVWFRHRTSHHPKLAFAHTKLVTEHATVSCSPCN